MAPQQAKPQGPSEAGPAAREPRDRPRERVLCGAGGISTRFQGVRSSGARRSQDAPPLRPLLLGLLLLAALPGHCRADSGKRLGASPRPRRGLGQLMEVGGGWWALGCTAGLFSALSSCNSGRTVRNLSLGRQRGRRRKRHVFISFSGQVANAS